MRRDDAMAGGLFLTGIVLMLGCTATEWATVGGDAIQAGKDVAPEVGAAAASGNLPYAITIGVAAVLGVVYRSALRDFGSASGAKVAKVVRSILGPIVSLFKR